jgi:hypothetical protein
MGQTPSVGLFNQRNEEEKMPAIIYIKIIMAAQ